MTNKVQELESKEDLEFLIQGDDVLFKVRSSSRKLRVYENNEELKLIIPRNEGIVEYVTSKDSLIVGGNVIIPEHESDVKILTYTLNNDIKGYNNRDKILKKKMNKKLK